MKGEPSVRFGLGSATGVAAADGVALVAAGPSSPTVELLSDALADGRPIVTVLAQLMATNPELLPAFVVARREAAGVRVVLRGDLAVVLHTSSGAEPFTAAGLSTWREELFTDVVCLSAGISDTEPLSYVITAGTFPAACLEWTLTSSSAAPAVGEPDAVIEPGAVTGPEVVPEQAAAAEPEPEPRVPTPDVPVAEPVVAVVEPAPSVAAPSAVSASVAVAPMSAPSAGSAPADVDDLDFSHLVEHTVYRQVEDAAVRVDPALAEAERRHRPPATNDVPPPSPALVPDPDVTIIGVPTAADLSHPTPAPSAPPNPAGTGERPGDHDGHTVMRRTSAAGGQPVVVVRSLAGRPSVLAVRCPQGHPNPPQTPACRVCGQGIISRATEQIERPTLGVLRFSTGLAVPVNGPLAVGRRPPDDQMLGAEVATAVAIDNSELSRFHAAVLVNDWYVQLADQGSTNGTMVSMPGQSDQVLRPNERVLLAHGCVINLGGAVSVSFDVV